MNATTIGVAVEDGIVTLLGHAAARVLGVKVVVNELEVQIPVARQVFDEEIARAAVDSYCGMRSYPAVG